MKGSINFNNDDIKLLSIDEYDALSETEKTNGMTYFVKNEDGTSAKIYKNGIDYTASADLATKAIQDGNGNNIADTYFPKSGGIVSGDSVINGLSTIRFKKNDNSAFPTYLLLFDITDWWNNNSEERNSFTGYIYSARDAGYTINENVIKLCIGASYQRGTVITHDGARLILCSDNTSYKPCVIHDTVNDRYYLSCRIIGSDRSLIFNGIIYGNMLTDQQLNATDANGTLPTGYEFMAHPDSCSIMPVRRAIEDGNGNDISATYSNINHTHNYAGSNGPGGWANTASETHHLMMNRYDDDMNSMQAYNWRYMGCPTVNYPIASSQWTIGDQYVHNDGWVIQRGNAFANDIQWSERYKLNGTWHPWFVDQKVIFSYNAPYYQCLWVY